VAVYNAATRKAEARSSRASIQFRKLSDYEIRNYVSRYPVTHFAGGFALDGAYRFASRAKGAFLPIMGLPMQDLIMLLRKQGLTV
jgi:predicted house-cleaning NTP pyrophosphatase (Maf/HAM1 superfamily)